TVHQVGDSNGWTIMSVNYERWASSRTFHVGDSLFFKYNKDFHDVTEVSHNDFKLCEPSKPLTRYETGSDTVILTKPGLQHFICGFPSHCDMGQKLQIHVLPASLGPVAAPNTIMGLLIVALSLFGFVRATSIYEVGDSNGWTTTVGFDYYKTWSSSKTFYVGDVLIFQYNKTFHNLMEVSFQDFESCNPNSPLTTYQSQYEPVILNRTGHYYFICDVPGHCESGQKLDVLVMPAS
ncbi:unnamed protein product, partial [Arabidopsis halleri]